MKVPYVQPTLPQVHPLFTMAMNSYHSLHIGTAQLHIIHLWGTGLFTNYHT